MIDKWKTITEEAIKPEPSKEVISEAIYEDVPEEQKKAAPPPSQTRALVSIFYSSFKECVNYGYS